MSDTDKTQTFNTSIAFADAKETHANHTTPTLYSPWSEFLNAIYSSVSSLSTDVVKFSRAVSSSSTSSSSSKWSAACKRAKIGFHGCKYKSLTR